MTAAKTVEGAKRARGFRANQTEGPEGTREQEKIQSGERRARLKVRAEQAAEFRHGLAEAIGCEP